MNPKELAVFFHDAYERLAPAFGYKTRPDTRVFDPNSPNGRLMIAVCETVLDEMRVWQDGQQHEDPECTCYEFIGGHQPGCPMWAVRDA